MFLATKKFPIGNLVRYPPDFNAPSFGRVLGRSKQLEGKNGQADSPHLDEEDDLTARMISDAACLGIMSRHQI
jgi:hypothetical protein